jgi:hypothetical protein
MRTRLNQTATIDSVFRPVLTALARFVQQLRDGQSTNGDAIDRRWAYRLSSCRSF